MTNSSKSNPNQEPNSSQGTAPWRRFNPQVWIVTSLFIGLLLMIVFQQALQHEEVGEDTFLTELGKGNVQEVKYVSPTEIFGTFKTQPERPLTLDATGKPGLRTDSKGKPLLLKKSFYVNLAPQMSEARKQLIESEYEKHRVQVKHIPRADNSALYLTIASILIPLALFALFWTMFRRTRDQFMGGGFLSGFTKSTAKRFEEKKKNTTFDDVAGLEGVKSDLMELVDYLKDPPKFQRLGGRVPKGVLLNGSPGTGKTLLARAVAGEAGVPFYSVNGSEFIQMFVGVGASRVRDLFQTAKENAPAIIFIDEIDAVGRQRGAGLGGGHDEREQTLNQILSEMDGFTQNDSVIVMAATNRPDVLDPALLRPGRFDRHITVDRPTLRGRKAIFKVHVRDVALADDVDLDRLAAGTVGMTGADIRNLVNEAALWATRNNKNAVSMEDFEYARDKILMGPKREEVMLGHEKEKTAYHEAGHALIAWTTPGNDRVHKVTVIPRGRALGVTQTLPEEDRMNITESELSDRLAFLLGGRAAEKLTYDEFSAGASNDLERATSLARRMVTQWGMSPRLGPVSYKLSDDDPFLGREMHQQRQFSEHTLQIIDEEVANILLRSEERAQEILTTNRDKLEKLSQELVAREELSEQEITELIGPSVHHNSDSKRNAVVAPNNGSLVSASTRLAEESP
jgi:cell division protease FtsH